MKKVLIIAYHFPPSSAIGAVRPSKFAKYLPEFGWQPVIYTVDEKYCEGLDHGRFEPRLHSLKIYRSKPVPGLLHLYSRLARTNKNFSGNVLGSKSTMLPSPDQTGPFKKLLSSFARLPDDAQGWIANIVNDGYRIVKREGIEVFLTTGPPMSAHIGGLLLKQLTNVKWVADFRDPWWPLHAGFIDSDATSFSLALEKWIAFRVVRKADVLVSTSRKVSDHFRSILPEKQGDKCVTITNGYDKSDFPIMGGSFAAKSSKIRITYAGTLYVNRNPEPLFAALHELIREGKIDKNKIQLELIGDCAYFNNVSVQTLIDEYDLSPMVQLVGKLPFHACLERLRNSDTLLLFAQGQPYQIPGKVFEYMVLNKPIFVLTGEGETKCVLEPFDHVFIADSENPVSIAETFLSMLDAVRKKTIHMDVKEKIKQYDIRALTGRLATRLS